MFRLPQNGYTDTTYCMMDRDIYGQLTKYIANKRNKDVKDYIIKINGVKSTITEGTQQ